MSEKPTDLANLLIRETYRPHSHLRMVSKSRSLDNLRQAVINSRRYRLDPSMSEFLAHLSTVPFTAAFERRPETLKSLRHSARLPFDKMFIELDGQAFRRGLVAASERVQDKFDFWGNKLVDHADTPKHIGYLLEAGPDGETVFITEFTYDTDEGKDLGVMSLPFRWAYRTDDMEFSPGKYDVNSGYFGHGLGGVSDKSIAVLHDAPIPKRLELTVNSELSNIPSFTTHSMIPEFGGVVRYMICFLATLNDAPVISTVVRPQKGYLARGQIRKYMEHTVLTLQLPRQMTQHTLARRLIAHARRRWHEVEPHWRINKKQGPLCEPSYEHLWSERNESGHSNCSRCGARRVWIVLPHGRGDPNLGIVHHIDRVVTHAPNLKRAS